MSAPAGAVPAFDVLDVFEGFAGLVRRSPTLDGSVPLRVARGCLPFLEGNAFGWQVVLSRPLRLSRGALGPRLVDEELAHLHAAALPRLLALGLVEREGAWHRALRLGLTASEASASLNGSAARWARRLPAVATALAGVAQTLEDNKNARLTTSQRVGRTTKSTRDTFWLRISGAANRRNALVEVEEALVPDDGALVPLVLTFVLPTRGTERVQLSGEVACLAPLLPAARFEVVPLAQAPEAARAHLAFYDRTYFEAKKGDVTGKYRRLMGRVRRGPTPAPVAGDAACRVVVAGPGPVQVQGPGRFLTAGSARPVARPSETRRLDSAVFGNLVAFRALYDGQTVSIEHDAARLASLARELRAAFLAALGPGFDGGHPGALLYLTKYFTPHTPGEPHFFVKPWAFVTTPPGWSCLVEGVHGDGWDVLRGVVATDVFHATPAVFQVRREGHAIQVAEGEPLIRVIPLPRSLLEAGFRRLELPES